MCFENTPRHSPTIHVWCRMIFPNQKRDIGSDPAAWITAPFIDLDTLSKAGSDVADDQVEAAETPVDVICVSCSLQVYYEVFHKPMMQAVTM